MGTRFKIYIAIFCIYANFFQDSHGCQIPGVTNWLLPQLLEIKDVHRGDIFREATTEVLGIVSATFNDGVAGGPYMNVYLQDSVFVLETNENYLLYEENETLDHMSVNVVMSCADGVDRSLIFFVSIIDTNNNDPLFKPDEEYEFEVIPPLPPNYQITNALNEIKVRDIDLTTQRIEFEIVDNPTFEISFDEALSTTPKEFGAVLRTTAFIRNIPEPLEIRIRATDVDLTGDPPRSTYTTVRIVSNGEFELPEELVFSQTFYMASYTENDEIILQETISLRQGYHEEVQFTLETTDEFTQYFDITSNENNVNLRVVAPIPVDALSQQKLFLAVRADREYTTGTSATIIVQLPEEVNLQFEKPIYEGRIVDNVLELSQLLFTQGYENQNISIVMDNEHNSYFSYTVQENIVTISMTSLDSNIIELNNFLNLQIVASTSRSSAITIVTLEIVKSDKVTPVFERAIYSGSYDEEHGLAVEQMVLIQGYDDVEIILEGEYADLFNATQSGQIIQLTVSNIPHGLYSDGTLLITIRATKERTVGANAAVSITLPTARELRFSEDTYIGTIQETYLILDPIFLSSGYAEDVSFNIVGDYATYFEVSNNQNEILVKLEIPLPSNAFSDNNFLLITLIATAPHAVTTSTTIILEIIKEDVSTPLFSQNIYTGVYTSSNFDIDTINLVQGYDDSVIFHLEGDNNEYFDINLDGPAVNLTLRSAIPNEIIFNEKVLLFNIIAVKPFTVGARAAVSIQFPTELTEPTPLSFSKNTYKGLLNGEVLTLEEIILDVGFTTNTEFILTGEYYEYFALTAANNIITITTNTTLPSEILDYKYIVLEVEARQVRAIPAFAIVIVEIVQPEAIVTPIFEYAFYRGVYTEANGLQFEVDINLLQGFDETVHFELQGEFTQWFEVTPNANPITITVNELPEDVINANHHLVFTVVAIKTGAESGSATIVIDLPKEASDIVVLRFTQPSYIGIIENNVMELSPVLLDGVYDMGIQLNLTGEFASYFSVTRQENVILFEQMEDLPSQIINDNTFINFDLQASYPEAISGFTSIILELVKETDEHIVTTVFEFPYYIGQYSEEGGLVFESDIQLIQGFDETVSFYLDGDDSKYFQLIENSQNSLSVSLSEDPIPQINDKPNLVFSIIANKPGSIPGETAILIRLTDLVTKWPLRFDQEYYEGSIDGDNLSLNAIILEEGYSTDVVFSLSGEFDIYFKIINQGQILELQLLETLPSELLDNLHLIILTLHAQRGTTKTHTTIILDLIKDIDEIDILSFKETYYLGSLYQDELVFENRITLNQSSENVHYDLEGENSVWFDLVRGDDDVKIILDSTIPPAIVANNQQLLFIITAQRPGSVTARATIAVLLPDDITETHILGFERISYVGSIEETTVNLIPIVLREGYTSAVNFTLHGELSTYFTLGIQDATVTLSLDDAIPIDSVPSNGIIVLELEASAPQTLSAFATVILEVTSADNTPILSELEFEQTFYVGTYTSPMTLTFDSLIMLTHSQTDPNVEFALEGENTQWFDLVRGDNDVSIVLTSVIPPAIVANNQQLLFAISAQRPGSVTARSTIVVLLPEDVTGDLVLGFEQISYVGSIEETTVNLIPIVLREGYTSAVNFTLHGELSTYFTLGIQDATVTLSLDDAIPIDSVPSNGIIVLELEASAPQTLSAFATVILEVTSADNTPILSELEFEQTFYVGTYTSPMTLTFDSLIMLTHSQTDPNVEFALEGENTQWFDLVRGDNDVSIVLTSAIPQAIVANNQQLLFAISAQRPGSVTARATIVVILEKDGETEATVHVSFDKTLYAGIIESGIVQHETIILNGFVGNDIDIIGVYNTVFMAKHMDGLVVIDTIGSLILPPNTQHLALELRADDAGAVLLLDVKDSGTPIIPIVSFDAPSYVIRAEIGQSGAVGRVQATADNGEIVTYALRIENEHLQARLSVTNDGELRLSAPADSGFYVFEVIATTIFTQTQGSVPIDFSVEAITTCGVNDIVTAPLIVIDRDEEQPHRDLFIINSTQHAGCRYSITNRWPANQQWLYVDDTGLHANAIDREDPSIAFMTLSQIQVELTLECDSDIKRHKRSTNPILNSLGPYDYGSNTWIIANTIEYDPRRTIVNLIVNDINDNHPIFVGKENEPIVVGYPVSDLQEVILPRSLVELQAVDADIGENAAIVYWSSEPQIAVSSLTGFVHVKNNAELTDNMNLVVSATDLNGQGHTGSILITVKLLDMTNIAVLSVREAFLEDESRILSNISTTIGYELKALRSTVITDLDVELQGARKKRNIIGGTGATLEIYLYGLKERKPVSVYTLSSDINEYAFTMPIDVSSVLSLEEHLQGQRLFGVSENNVGLLAATIVLSILLFVILVTGVVWFLIKRRSNESFKELIDESSVTSESETPSLETKVDVTPRSRLNIEELKRSEKRLQEMLNMPIVEETIEDSTSVKNTETISNPDTTVAPIVIQDKLKDAEESDDDEFGEIKEKRRKSVVTFNENVEKIIHVRDTPDDDDETNENEYDFYKF